MKIDLSRSRAVRRSWVAGLLLAVMGAELPGAPAFAQEPARPQPEAQRQNATPRMLSNALARLAIFDLRAVQRPTDSDFQIASILLGMAHELQPQNVELLRRQLEAAWGAGDQDQVLQVTRAILALDPQDTVAQLRLITTSIASNNQNAEDRLAAYERYLSPEGRAFSPAIRSRLALDAALLLRERGDVQGFVEKLKLSLALDSTHKEAAALAAMFFTEQRPDDRVGRLTLLQNLLLADPVDPNVHLTIARELAAGRAFKGAQRAYRNAINIHIASGQDVDEELRLQSRILQWHVEGPAAVARSIRNDLLTQRSEAARKLRQYRGAVPRGAMRPEDVRLPAPLATLALQAARAADDEEAIRTAFAELSNTIQFAMKLLEDPEYQAQLGAGMARRASVELFVQIQMARLWGDLEVEQAAEDLGKSPVVPELLPRLSQVLDGWVKLRTGEDIGEAMALLRPHAEENPAARFGVAMAHEKAGDSQQAIAEYSRLAQDSPLTSFGAWASTRLRSLGVKEDTRGVMELERAAAQIPDWVDRMITNPREFVHLTISLASRAPEVIEAAPLKITLENLAPVPLALGSDRALNSRILLSPRLDMQDQVLSRWARPEIVDIDRRLRLMDRQRLEVEVNPEYGHVGWMMEALGNRSLKLRWRATQGFVLDRFSGFRPGVMSVVAESDLVLRRPLSEASLPANDLLDLVVSGRSDEVPRAAAVIRAAIMQLFLAPSPEEQAVLRDPEAAGQVGEMRAKVFRPIAEAFAQRYASLPPMERAIVAALLPHAGLEPGMEPFDQAVRADEHPLPLAVALVTRVKSAEDELLSKAAGSPDARIRQIAFLVAERIGAEDVIYARLTPQSFPQVVPQEQPEEER